MVRCVNCIYYKENPEFDYYDNSMGSYATCEMDSHNFGGEFESVFQETWGYEIECDEYKDGE